MIYLDKASTTQVSKKVLRELYKSNKKFFGNPSSSHKAGSIAKDILNYSTTEIMNYLNCPCDLYRLIFTSGATEGNNMVFQGIKDYLKSINKTHIVVSNIEHKSVLNACKQLEKEGFEITYAKANILGIVSIKSVEEAIKKNTGLVSVMAVNNEIGTIQPLHDIGNLCHKNGILFHTDMTQAVGHIPISFEETYPFENVDFATFSGHKFNALKGIGGLIISNNAYEHFSPSIFGGNQQFGKRAGTENINGIISMRVALKDKINKMEKNNLKIKKKEQFLDRLMTKYIVNDNLQYETTGQIFNLDNRFKGIKMICFYYLDKNSNQNMIIGQNVLTFLNKHNVCASIGSACDNMEISHTLQAVYGNENEDALHCLRLSFDEKTTYYELFRFVIVLKKYFS